MGKKGKGRKGGGGRKRRGAKGAVISISGVVGILLILNRVGIISQAFFTNLQTGNLGGMVSTIEQNLLANFATPAGVALTIALFIGYLVISLAFRFAMRGKTVPLRGKPRALGA